MPEPYRVAVYYAPEADDPLWRAGCEWLGRDPESGAVLAQPALAGLHENTQDPRRYGFHATLKAPMVPRHGFERFLSAAKDFAARQKPFLMPRLEVMPLHGFLALCPAEPAASLYQLANACVEAFDAHRLPESAAAQARRAQGRTPRQAENIARWGYPLVFEDFEFHMTLSGKMQDNPYVPAARAHFAASLAQPRMARSLAVFIEESQGAAFRLFQRLAFGA